MWVQKVDRDVREPTPQFHLSMMSTTPSQTPNARGRKKTTEACDPCRAKKLKCDGLMPCKSCERNKAQCCYDPSTAANRLNGGLDMMNARVLELERAVFGERTYRTGDTVGMRDAGVSERSLPRAIVCEDREWSSAIYGPTSTLMLLNDVKPTSPQVEGTEATIERPRKRARREHSDSESFDQMELADRIYEYDRIQNPGNLCWRENIANRHLDYFFKVVHSTYPIITEATFRDIWHDFWDHPNSTDETNNTLQTRCAINSALCLGALYMNTSQDTKWATSYFAEARKLIGSLFDGANILTVQASMLMAVYAHHTSQPNLAYNYLGTAIRLAYTLGINNMHVSNPHLVPLQPALRAWWLLYSLESDICIEYGRPLCIRERDANAPYPSEEMDGDETVSRIDFIKAVAKFGRILRKVIDLAADISERNSNLQSFVGRLMNHQAELMTWRGDLPTHLAPKEIAPTGGPQAWAEFPWVQQQRCEIELRE
ncbi:uncharacterized protein N7503_005322 [Penicillium pulvis]|uniref:uncharacterized protein n=1 Tax=Penicillium pulvis TaxID=1562058 RepID=UPI0025492097|nr:uncharacterized protein N7503_005322 [Penicillium pulvis]KAJ5802872.1 hypothetical protein N7503_005322 [Penicillium pulvis]